MTYRIRSTTFLTKQLKMSKNDIISTGTLEKRETYLGTSPKVVRIIPRKAGLISGLSQAKTHSKANKKKKTTALKMA